MEEIRLWKILSKNEILDIKQISHVKETETEKQLEEIVTQHPNLLMDDLKLIGRQTETSGGPLDLLGVDGDGNLVIFELKRGALTRDAVAQIIDYSSYLASLEPKQLSEHISSRSGNLGIEKIDNFLDWYQEQFGKSLTEIQRPRMVLVGLGADEKTKRMVSFLSESDLDISLTTFHGFQEDKDIFLAKQIEVQSKPQTITAAYTKKNNLEKLKLNVKKLKVDGYFYEIASFIRDQFPAAYQWPNASGYSYGLPELTEAGNQSHRVYIALYLSEPKPGCIQIVVYNRSIQAAAKEFDEFKNNLADCISERTDGNYELWLKAKSDWEKIKNYFENFCPAIIQGWKQKRDQQSLEEFESADNGQNRETVSSEDD